MTCRGSTETTIYPESENLLLLCVTEIPKLGCTSSAVIPVKSRVGRVSHETLNMVSGVSLKYVCHVSSSPEVGGYAQSQTALDCQEPKNINK